jgi:hypothetical protein
MAYVHDEEMLARLNALGIRAATFSTFQQATLLLNFLEPQPDRSNRLPTNDQILGDDTFRNIAFGHLYHLLSMTVGKRRRELVDDETTRSEVLMQLSLCRDSSFSGPWLDELDELLNSVEYTEAVAAADRCSNVVTEHELRVKRAEDRLSAANFAEALASCSVLNIQSGRGNLNLHGHWEFH